MFCFAADLLFLTQSVASFGLSSPWVESDKHSHLFLLLQFENANHHPPPNREAFELEFQVQL